MHPRAMLKEGSSPIEIVSVSTDAAARTRRAKVAAKTRRIDSLGSILTVWCSEDTDTARVDYLASGSAAREGSAVIHGGVESLIEKCTTYP